MFLQRRRAERWPKGLVPRRRAVTVLGLLAVLAAGLLWSAGGGPVRAGALASPVASPADGTAVRTIEDVIAALRAAGLAVERTDQTVEQPFFAVPATILRVNGQDLQVFVYPTVAARTADSDQISADGTQIGTSMVSWIAKPHFTAVDNVLTLFVSNDEGLAQRIAAAVAGVGTPERASPVASPAGGA